MEVLDASGTQYAVIGGVARELEARRLAFTGVTRLETAKPTT